MDHQVESSHKEYTRLLTRIMDDVKKLNGTGIGRMVTIGIEVPRGREAPKLVAHGDSEMIHAVAISDIKDKMKITKILSQTATLPMIDASALGATTDEIDQLRGMVDVLEVELRPRKKFYFKQSAPEFWVVGVPYQSVYSAEVRPHIGKLIQNYLQYSEERRKAIEKGEDTDKYDRSIVARTTAANQLSKVQRSAKEERERKKQEKRRDGEGRDGGEGIGGEEEGEDGEDGIAVGDRGGTVEGVQMKDGGEEEEYEQEDEEEALQKKEQRRPPPRGFRVAAPKELEKSRETPKGISLPRSEAAQSTTLARRNGPITIAPPCAKKGKIEEEGRKVKNEGMGRKVEEGDREMATKEQRSYENGRALPVRPQIRDIVKLETTPLRVRIEKDGQTMYHAMCREHTSVEDLLSSVGMYHTRVTVLHDGNRIGHKAILRCVPSVSLMSRKYSSKLNLGGLPECSITRSPSRSPSRPRVAVRNRKKREQTVLQEDNALDMAYDLPPLSQSDILQRYVSSLKDEYVPRAINNDNKYILLPECNPETGDLIRDVRRLSYQAVNIEGAVYGCTCNKTLSAVLDSLCDRKEHHVDQLIEDECVHAMAVREGGYDQRHDKLRLFVTFPDGSPPGVVRATSAKVVCLLCHKETCVHVSEISGSPYLDRTDDEDTVEGERIQWRTETSRVCNHDEPIHSREKETMVADEKGILRKELVIVEKSMCCKHIVTLIPVFCLTEGMLFELPLLQFYESLLAMNGTTLSGYWRALNDYAKRLNRPSEDLVSLSSLSRAWNSYLIELEIPMNKFGCEQCGQFPNALVFDGLQMGIRTSIANEQSLTRGKYTFPDFPLPYLGTMQQRKAMLLFVKGKGDQPRVTWPDPVRDLLKEAIDDKKKVKEEYKEILRMLFANSPLPLLFQAGTTGDRRSLLDRFINGSMIWSKEEIDLQRSYPTIYRSIRPLITSNGCPEGVRNVIDFVRKESDGLLKTNPHIEEYYGPATDSNLECFPLWNLERGVTRYAKDFNRDEEQLECAEKVVGTKKKLSPGLMLVMCTHRRPYGFRILKTPESVKDVFEILLTRLGSHMPSYIIYDNACRLAVYTLAREPNRFANVRFLVDRFHSDNPRMDPRRMREIRERREKKWLEKNSLEMTHYFARNS